MAEKNLRPSTFVKWKHQSPWICAFVTNKVYRITEKAVYETVTQCIVGLIVSEGMKCKPFTALTSLILFFMESNECSLTNLTERLSCFLSYWNVNMNGNVLFECLELMLLTSNVLTFFFKSYKTNVLGKTTVELFLFQSAFFVLLKHSGMKAWVS